MRTVFKSPFYDKGPMLRTSSTEQEELIQDLARRNEEESSFNLLALDSLICLSFLMYVLLLALAKGSHLLLPSGICSA
jgi:hypothetical protein